MLKFNFKTISYIIITLLIFTFLSSPRITKKYNYKIGDTAKEAIYSDKNFSITDIAATKKIKADVADKVKNVYIKDEKMINYTIQDINKYIQADSGTVINDTNSLLREINRIVNNVRKTGYFPGNFEEKDYEIGISLIIEKYLDRIVKNEIIVPDIKSFIKQILSSKEELDNYITQNLLINTKIDIKDIITKLIKSNIYKSTAISQDRINAAVNKIIPKEIQIKKGQRIVKEGDKITKKQNDFINKLKNIEFNTQISLSVKIFLFYIVLTLFMLTYIKFFVPEMLNNKNEFIILIIIFLLPLLLVKIFSIVISTSDYAGISLNLIFAVPIASAVILTTILLYFRLAILVNVITVIASAFIFAINTQGDHNKLMAFTLVFIFMNSISGIVGGYFIAFERRRKAIIKSGFIVAVANSILLFLFYTTIREIFKIDEFLNYISYIAIVINGIILVPVLAIGMLPFFENIFNVTTYGKLLELSDVNTTLLKELALKAPGTYQHSLVVANLAEAGAESIKANSLLARVGAYYHDIGKMNKPDYFAENQSYMKNPHEELKPSLSNSILKAHVKIGLELAIKNKLPKAIQDIIVQHHGKTTMKYFFSQALELAENTDLEVDEEEYRYPGPTPQFKEAAIIGLADTVEAAARTLKNPTPVRVSEMVWKIFRDRVNHGELDECDLTFLELKKIASTFIRILTTMYHTRIEYPEDEEIEQNKKKQKK